MHPDPIVSYGGNERGRTRATMFSDMLYAATAPGHLSAKHKLWASLTWFGAFDRPTMALSLIILSALCAGAYMESIIDAAMLAAFFQGISGWAGFPPSSEHVMIYFDEFDLDA